METYSFGEWVKRRREGLRLTQRELAAAAHCSMPMLKKIEADQRRPSPELARLLAVALQVPERSRLAFVAAARGERAVDALWPIGAQRALEVAGTAWQELAPAPLPRPGTAFIGRDAELREIGARLAEPDCRLLTLVGPGGTGKTRLALEAAESWSQLKLGGRASTERDLAGTALPEVGRPAFVALAGVSEARAVPEAMARSLRLTLSGPPGEQVIASLRRWSVLLLLDNCEQLAGDPELVAWLAELLAQVPGAKVLATSRQRLHLAEEWVYAVGGLTQAEALFVERARRVRQDFDAAAEAPAIRRICALVEGLPLAVELAAGWTSLLACAQIAAHLERDLTLLTTDARNVPERHRSWQAVCSHSWQLLTGQEQQALRRLSVFREGWQLEEAQAVAGADLHLLRRLADKSLVRAGEQGRFDLHDLIRQDAAQRLEVAGETAEARRRHLEAYCALAARLDEAQFGPGAMAAVARFDQEQGNLRQALEWGLAVGSVDAAMEVMHHLWFYWSRRGAYREASEWAGRAIAAAGDQESVLLSVTLSSAAVLGFIEGRFGEAQALAQRALAMAQRLEDPEALIMAYGTATFTSVTLEQALEGLNRAIRLTEVTGKGRELRPLLYNGAATWLHSSGRHLQAREYYERSVALFRELGAEDFIAEPLGRLGQLALLEGRLQEAHDLTVESMAAGQATGYDVVYWAWGRARLGQIQLYMGDTAAAQASLEAALAWLADDAGYDRDRQETLALLSEAALARADTAAAAAYMQACLEICAKLYRELEAAQKLETTADALPIDLVGLCARAGLLAAAQGEAARAAMLFGAAEALEADSGLGMVPGLRAQVAASAPDLRMALGEDGFTSARAAGRGLSSVGAFKAVLGRGSSPGPASAG
jgi:predicted ATPase/transcriptional regulator with XRE-family HTH domain